MRRRRLATAFQSMTPITPRLSGVISYSAFAKYREALNGNEECTTGDPIDQGLRFESLLNQIAIPQVDQYGFQGFEQRRTPFDSSLLENWTICPNYDYCDGPETEGITQPTIYTTRWAAQYFPDSGTIKYGKKDGSLVNASALLFPLALNLSKDDQISISFDANARASFAFQAGASTIEIRRFEAGTPTTYSFSGTTPRLFYDGTLQRNNTEVDLICFYLNGGAICARFQRDNFAVEYVIYTPPTVDSPARITKTDKQSYYQVLYFVDSVGKKFALRSEVYQPFPEYYSDAALSVVVPLSGDYGSPIVTTGPYLDAAVSLVEPLSGAYNSNTVISGPYSDSAGTVAIPLSGAYNLVTVQSGPYSDAAGTTVIPLSGAYNATSVNGGTYSDAANSLVQPLSGTYN
jgi:hypothetical protein